MTERSRALLVHLDDDYRIGDEESGTDILNAIRMVKGVVKVEPMVSDWEHVIAREDARRELRAALWEVLK